MKTEYPVLEATILEQFLYNVPELRLYVIYTYYDKDFNPLYVGASHAFYDTHALNYNRKSMKETMEKAVYVGFVFYDDEETMKELKKYWIAHKNPIYNKRKNLSLEIPYGIVDSDDDDELIVSKDKLEKYWRWHNGDAEIKIEDLM